MVETVATAWHNGFKQLGGTKIETVLTGDRTIIKHIFEPTTPQQKKALGEWKKELQTAVTAANKKPGNKISLTHYVDGTLALNLGSEENLAKFGKKLKELAGKT